jgi:hypothetical protein
VELPFLAVAAKFTRASLSAVTMAASQGKSICNCVQSVIMSTLVPAGQTLVVLMSDMTVKKAMEVLYAARITSAPVIHAGKLIGTLDMLDLLAFLAFVHRMPADQLTNQRQPSEFPTVVFRKDEDADLLGKRSAEWNLMQVKNIIGLSGRAPLVRLPFNTSTLPQSIER